MADCKKVAVIMGSDSDFPTVSGAVKTLKSYGVPVEVHVMSAHRTPEEAARFSSQAKAEGFGVIIGGGGESGPSCRSAGGPYYFACDWNSDQIFYLRWIDALLATVQMPKGIGDTVAIDGGQCGAAGGPNFSPILRAF